MNRVTLEEEAYRADPEFAGFASDDPFAQAVIVASLRRYARLVDEHPLQIPDDVHVPCTQADPDIFHGRDTDRAKEVCADCPILATCLVAAMERGEYGVWGGTTRAERMQMKRDIAANQMFDDAFGKAS